MQKDNAMACWCTPLTDARSVVMTSLEHEGSLTLTFRADFGRVVSLVSFCFRKPTSYNLDSLDPAESAARALPGYTFRQSRFIESVNESPLFNLREYSLFALDSCNQLEADRYVFVLEQKTIEVFSPERPDIRVIGSQMKLAS